MQKKLMQRDDRIDIIKGLAICLVVLGHCGCPAMHFIYLFHVAVFFMASGYVYKQSYSESFDGLKKFFLKRVKSLWLPFVLYKVIFSLLWNPLVKMQLYDADLITPLQFIKNLGMIFLMMGKAPMCGALWFLSGLFYTTIIYALLDYFFNRMMICHKRFFHLLFAFGVFIFTYFLVKNESYSTKLTLIQLLSPYMVYVFGVELAYQKKWILDKINSIMVFIISLLVLLVCNDAGSISLAEGIFTSPWFFIVASISGWFLLLSLASYIQLKKFLREIFVFIGKNTLCIVGLHFISFKLVCLMQLKIYNLPIESLKSFPVLFPSSGWWCVYFIVGVIVPLFLNLIYKTFKNFICK